MPASKNSLLCLVSSANAKKISFLNVSKYSLSIRYFSHCVLLPVVQGIVWYKLPIVKSIIVNLHLKAHAVQQISSVLVTVRQVRQILSAKETDGCLASAPYAD